MERQGYAKETIRTNDSSIRALLARNANLIDRSIEQKWSQNRRRNVINAYTLFLKVCGMSWEKPRCNVTRKIPWLPTEAEINDLIAGCPVKLATYLQLLKETAMRSGEAMRLLWTDIDFEKNIITLNEPEKNSLPRQWEGLTPRLMEMLNALPREDLHIFGHSTKNSLKAIFSRSRHKLSIKLQNPRLTQIHFHTLRHWKATMEYHRTQDLVRVMRFLGHKKIDNTMLYIQLEEKQFKDCNDQFIIKAIHNEKEAVQLGEIGFEPFDVVNGVRLYRKRK
jgi:integrase